MSDTINKICTIVALLVMAVSLFICGECCNRAKKAEARLIEIESQVYKRLGETEEKCQRYCNTCIDILANKRWE
jgi:hypothetical protein